MRNVMLLVSLCALALVKISVGEKIKVSIYYESLCPNSILFMVTQLKPTFNKIGNYTDIDLVPYGKATHTLENGEFTFKCQHGQLECYGNKLQACALNQNLPQAANVNFVACVMGSFNPAADSRIKTCAEKYGFSYEEIQKCSTSSLGPTLLAGYGDRTHNVVPKITFVPTIIFNDEYNLNVQIGSQFNLFGTLCNALKQKPDICQ